MEILQNLFDDSQLISHEYCHKLKLTFGSKHVLFVLTISNKVVFPLASLLLIYFCATVHNKLCFNQTYLLFWFPYCPYSSYSHLRIKLINFILDSK